ncbi:sialate O-acetylesterase [Novipirellula artificiosorum]|uniref:Sialate O-acetylesterase domain-containing protein n=1 Tax=Novipirellula artificiosorum TaxID=2528016 RepID=A0A5C6DV21_9BACT|nr:sialate O-acetylesterase [Novipirellula artificiosorum]TWU39797.1 hypothetical protein Poly41_26530 [Novipirellula artificiosorum]
MKKRVIHCCKIFTLLLGTLAQAAIIVDFTHQDGTHVIRAADVYSLSGDTWAPICADDYSIATYAPRIFSDIWAVGIYLKQTSASQTILQLTDFQVSATTTNNPLVDIDFANIFSNGCVLQRGQTVPIWGTATPGDTITVEMNGQSQQGIADGQGNWRIALDPETAGGPYTLGATGSVSGPAELTLVYFGDVWILTGQSNMYQTLGGQVRNFPDDYPAVPDNSDNFDDMRFAIVDIVTANTAADDVTMERSWTRWQKSALGSMSTVGYFFARALNEQMDANGMADVPLGFIKVCKGGTSIEEWIAEDKWRAAKTANPGLVVASDASGYYNGMMAPIQDYAIKGAIWYQGEAHTASLTRIEQYPILKQTLVEAWREQWNNPDMPFYFVQLAPYKAYTPLPADELWAWMRESQESCQSISNTAMACIIDGGHQCEIHPPFKDRVGERLARLALDQTYGISTVHRGPTLQAMSISGSVATLTFHNVASGLETRANDSQPDADEIAEGYLPVSVSANELAGFFLCGADKRFYPALEATITASNQVRISNPSDVPSPVAVRYAFQNYPRCNLFNSEGLPAEPFRTDDYDFGEAQTETNGHRSENTKPSRRRS